MLPSGEHVTTALTATEFVETLADRYPLKGFSRSAAIAWPSGHAAPSIGYATSTTSEPPAIRRHPAIRPRTERNGIHNAHGSPLVGQSTRCADASPQKQARTASGRGVSLAGARRLSRPQGTCVGLRFLRLRVSEPSGGPQLLGQCDPGQRCAKTQEIAFTPLRFRRRRDRTQE